MKRIVVAFCLSLLMATGVLAQGYYGGYVTRGTYPNSYGNPYVTDQSALARQHYQMNMIGPQYYNYNALRSSTIYNSGFGPSFLRGGGFGRE